jgi:hypothetical protein
MLQAHLDIAEHAGRVYGLDLRARVHRDLGNYMYPTLAHQAHVPSDVPALLRRPAAHGVLALPAGARIRRGHPPARPGRTDRILYWLRRRIGHTPVIGQRPRPIAVGKSPERAA